MKELLVGFYDYPFCTQIYELKNDKLTAVHVGPRSFFSKKTISFLRDYLNRIEFSGEYNDLVFDPDFFPINKNFIQALSQKYDRITICEDGHYTILVKEPLSKELIVQIDKAMENVKKGKVGKALDLNF